MKQLAIYPVHPANLINPVHIQKLLPAIIQRFLMEITKKQAVQSTK